MDRDSVFVVVNGLADNVTLKSLDLSGNEVDSDVANALIAALKRNKNLVDVPLCPGSVCEETCKEIKDLCEENRLKAQK